MKLNHRFHRFTQIKEPQKNQPKPVRHLLPVFHPWESELSVVKTLQISSSPSASSASFARTPLPIVAHTSSLCDFQQQNLAQSPQRNKTMNSQNMKPRILIHRFLRIRLSSTFASSAPFARTPLPTVAHASSLCDFKQKNLARRSQSPQRNKTMNSQNMKPRILIHRFSKIRLSTTFASLAPFARNPLRFPLSAIRSPISAFRPLFQLSVFSITPLALRLCSLHQTFVPSLGSRRYRAGFPLFLLLLLSSCASSQPRSVGDRYTSESNSRVVSRGPVPMDDAEARSLASGGQTTSTPVKKKTTSGGRTTSEETITTTATETVVGSQAVAAPDAEVSPR